MRFIELFAGIRGFKRGLEKASKEYQCVWANEWDKYACQISRKNYPNDTLVEGDIRAGDPSSIPEHDLICAGFPCQSFSIAGKRGGFEDTRGTLFFEIMRIAGAKRTPYLLLENVKGLLSHDEGDTFQTILRTLDELGYNVQWQVLNSKDFGVPQNRERVFIIGHLRGKPRPKVFPIGETDQVYTEPDGQISHAIDSNYHKGWLDNQQRTMIQTVGLLEADYSNDKGFHGTNYRPRHRVLSDKGIGRSLSTYENQMPYVVASRGRNPDNPSDRSTGSPTEQRLEPNEQGISNSKTNVRKDNWVAQGSSIRRLTPIECERLQGFPDNWTEGISDTQRYKCLGNAVTTNVIEAIGRQWLGLI